MIVPLERGMLLGGGYASARCLNAYLSMKFQPCLYCSYPGTNKMHSATAANALHWVTKGMAGN
eukprot:2486371-Alexandrium_andersonii.AAC.1